MTTVSVTVKHAGKAHTVELDTSKSVPEFREQLYNITGVVPAQQKILLKGVLKDDVNLSKLGIKSVSWIL
jgi:ubiquitin carboxyl-terminal hydrolase 14